MNHLPTIVSCSVAAAAGIAAFGAVVPSSELFGPTLRHTESSRKIALTFDDGPNPAITPQLLDLFERYSVRGTFFLIGKFARACPALVKEIYVRGHLIGNHTDTHANLIWETREGIRSELAHCQDAIASVTGTEPPRWMRPPYGYRSPLLRREIRRAGIQGVVMWSKICWDWKPQPPQRLIKRLASVARPGRSQGDIVVMHDGDHRFLNGDRQHVVTALEHWLPRWRDAGMEFVTMESSSAVEMADSTRPPRA
ncbi:MAG TPA: polysaccharide deacetylase family protein [Candidatus Acidoferrales bacterium]|nr:polysaccharide deacetylase family protein [Candidatus Acidoferrales bacterium]